MGWPREKTESWENSGLQYQELRIYPALNSSTYTWSDIHS